MRRLLHHASRAFSTSSSALASLTSAASSASPFRPFFVSAASAATPAAAATSNSAPPAFRFGVIADVQYADMDDSSNFAGTRTRRYRHSLRVLEEAVAYWNDQVPDAAFVAQLGDLIDCVNVKLPPNPVTQQSASDYALERTCQVRRPSLAYLTHSLDLFF